MICTGAACDRKDRCALYYMNPQPEYRKYDNLESLANHGWGSINSEGGESHWDCGPCGNYAMFEQIPDEIVFKQIAEKLKLLGNTSYDFTLDHVKEALRKLEEESK